MSTPPRALIVEEKPNPSSDFFVVPELRAQGYCIEHVSHSADFRQLDTQDAVLVFVRYIPSAWQAALASGSLAHSGLIYFSDDDLFSQAALKGMPLRYRWKIHKLAGRRVYRWLRSGVRVECWWSSPQLQARYPALQGRVIKPRPAVPEQSRPVTVFYHASASHIAEMRWLLPVMREVLARDPAIRFEVIGNPEVYAEFRRLPRTAVLMPMDWAAYRAMLAGGGRHIGLAPLLNSAFNASRSPTKFFDITAAGACGIYADHVVYRDLVCDGEDGLRLPMEPQRWVETILGLAAEEDRRQRLAEAARQKCRTLAGVQ
ncbi:glycosyltransferase [Granulosicoccaceae sp. 1_MG-2023]|nr:glycosyltransferase [Granulosicoccaceae sp. 1_MG-2023]